MALNVLTFNVRGISEYGKRKDIFTKIRAHKAHIIFLQEIHSTNKVNQIWKNEWGRPAYFSNGTSNARGVAILYDSNTHIEVLDTISDYNGRYIIQKIKYLDITICLCNVYAPNDDDPTFFENIFQEMEKMECQQHIIGGDYNLVLDEATDHWGNKRRKNNVNSKEVILRNMEKFELCDAWKLLNPDIHQYTWTRLKPSPVMSRLDFFLVSMGLYSQVKECNISHSYRSDHSIVQIKIEINEMKRGPGTWKMNTAHLDKEEYCQEISRIIDEGKVKYITNTPAMQWELIKQDIITYSRKFAKN